jgi:transcriptional regulator with GAF, ATPase, and Fis domain
MTGGENVISLPAMGEGAQVLEQLAPDMCRLLAEPHSDGMLLQIRTMLARMTRALGADDASVRCARPGGAPTQVATSESAAQLIASLAEGPWFSRQLGIGARIVLARGAADLPPEAERERECVRAAGVQALVACSVHPESNATGDLTVFARRPLMRWVTPALDQLESLATLFGRAVLWAGRTEPVSPDVGAMGIPARSPRVDAGGAYSIVGDSDALRYVLYRVDQVAPTNATVLLLGETGTGKELIARAIHDRSPRRHRNMVVVNCGALPATLIESELFGRERGAFTGAQTSQAGRFELANGGTLFLDEIGELPMELQPKLLRVLQEGKVERLGATRPTNVDVRVVAATNRNLAEEVRRGAFRRDLFYRLNVFPITLPALRERREDLVALVHYLVDRLGRQLGRHVQRIPLEAMRALERYDWPGNVRELENVLQQAIILSRDGTLELSPMDGGKVDDSLVKPQEESNALVDVERVHIRRVLRNVAWRIEGSSGAAQVLGLRPSTLRSRMRKLGIQRPAVDALRHEA